MLRIYSPNSIFQNRKSERFFANLITDHLQNDEERYRNYIRTLLVARRHYCKRFSLTLY